MPAVSEAQRRYLYATKGPAWVKRHHFDNEGPLPAHAAKSKHVAKQLSKGARATARFEAALKKLAHPTSEKNPRAET